MAEMNGSGRIAYSKNCSSCLMLARLLLNGGYFMQGKLRAECHLRTKHEWPLPALAALPMLLRCSELNSRTGLHDIRKQYRWVVYRWVVSL